LDSSVRQIVCMIPVVGFATVKRFDLADRLVRSIDHPVEHLVIIDNSGTGSYNPPKNTKVKNTWVIPMPFGIGLVGAWNLIIKSTPYASYWVCVNDDAWFEPGALKKICHETDPATMNFPSIIPHWSCAIFGEAVVSKVGLYDERFYPLYFDDNDMERRIKHHGFEINWIDAKVHHDNSSTLNSGFQDANGRTFGKNQKLMDDKIASEDYSEGNWSLQVRRDNRWD
jgi:GT2 family glycosyltransferase